MNIVQNIINKFKRKSFPLFRSGWDLGSREVRYSELFSFENSTSTSIGGTPSIYIGGGEKGKSRIAKKPVEIFKEIISETPKFNTSNLDDQIKFVTHRMKVLKEQLNGAMNLSDETQALSFLNARKKFEKNKDLFQWAVATFSGIKSLCEKYEVQFVDCAAYYKTMPTEALEQLEKYGKAYSKVCSDKPILKLIVESGEEKPEVKKDPILLASSPFGRWWYILGAWDKEVEIVDDLIYKGK